MCVCVCVCVCVLYTHDLRNSMNERTHFFIKIYKNLSLTLYSRKGWCFCAVWEMGGETYTQWEDFFFPYLLPGARGCQPLHPLARSSETPLINCGSLARLRFSALWIWLCGSHLVIPFWLHNCSTWVPWHAVIFLFTNQKVTAYQSTWGH